jgi:GxxExxY protein
VRLLVDYQHKRIDLEWLQKFEVAESVYKVDLLVEDLVVVEVKCVEAFAPVHKAQLLTYMRLMNKPAGLLINFNVARLMDGVKRLLNTY